MSASYLYLHLEIDSEGRLRTKLYDKRDFSIFPLWTFQLNVATFQQHLHMEYISLGWYSRACGSYQYFLGRWLLLTRKLLNQGLLFVITSKVLPLCNICVTNDHEYVPLVVNTSRTFSRSWLITGFVSRVARRVPLVEQELPTLLEHLSSPPDFSGVRVTRSLVLCVCFVDRCFSFCPFSFDHCVVCSSSIYGFWLPLWYLQTLLPSILIYNFIFTITYRRNGVLIDLTVLRQTFFVGKYGLFLCILSFTIYHTCLNQICLILLWHVIPASPAYGVHISQLIRFARASSNYSDFLKRHLHLRNRLLDQDYKKIRLIRSLKKFIFRYQDLVEIYSVSAETIISGAFSYSENV